MKQGLLIAAIGLTAVVHILFLQHVGQGKSQETPPVQAMRPQSPVAAVAEIGPDLRGERVTIHGRVCRIVNPTGTRSPHRIIIRDKSGAVEVIHWLRRPLDVGVGDEVELSGTVDIYRGELQLRLWSCYDIKSFDESY